MARYDLVKQTAIRETKARYVDGSPLQLALRELQRVFSNPRSLVVMALAAVVLGLSGPFGTFEDLPLAERLIYWLVIVVTTYATGRVVGLLVITALGPHIGSRWARGLIGGVVVGLPVTAIVLVINTIAFSGSRGLSPLVLWFFCTIIAVASVLTLLVLTPDDAEPGAVTDGVAPSTPDEPPAILDRLPHPQRGRLVALSVKDHYVEVLTDKGRSLVLMRLSDAMRETGCVAGLQIHRSHWVALDAVTRVVRSDGRVSVELASGDRLPISRGFLPAAKQAGLVV
jgi:hypothetical protein